MSEVKHIQHTHADLKGKSWCGADIQFAWVFQDLDHAAYNALRGGFTLACRKCVNAAVAALTQTEAVDNLKTK